MQFFRRSMLQVMVSGALCSALPSIAFAQTQKLAPEYDVIVIGSGLPFRRLKTEQKLPFWKKCRSPAATLLAPAA